MTVENIFSYGTLQQENVQLATFKRKLSGHEDVLVGWILSYIDIKDENVVKTSGKAHHPIIKFTGNNSDTVEGMIFEITPEELAAADTYEVDDYQRTKLKFLSGKEAWVYVAA